MNDSEKMAVFAAAAFQARLAERLRGAYSHDPGRASITVHEEDLAVMANGAWNDAEALLKAQPGKWRTDG